MTYQCKINGTKLIQGQRYRSSRTQPTNAFNASRSFLLSSLRTARSMDITSRCWALQGSRSGMIRMNCVYLFMWFMGVAPTSWPGRDWITNLKGNLNPIHAMAPSDPLQSTLDKHAPVFKEELGCLKGTPVKLMVPENTHPKFYKPRPVPIMLKPKVEDELKRLQDAGIISPVRSSPWAAPVVPVLKKDGKIRLCGDYKLTINQVAFTETYPLPRADELFAKLSGGKFFSKLDLASAYLQLPLDDESKQLIHIKVFFSTIAYPSESQQLQRYSNDIWRLSFRALMVSVFTSTTSWLLAQHWKSTYATSRKSCDDWTKLVCV